MRGTEVTRWKWWKEMYYFRGRVVDGLVSDVRVDPFFHAHEDGENVAACGCNKHIVPHIPYVRNMEEPNEGSQLCPRCVEVVKERVG